MSPVYYNYINCKGGSTPQKVLFWRWYRHRQKCCTKLNLWIWLRKNDKNNGNRRRTHHVQSLNGSP